MTLYPHRNEIRNLVEDYNKIIVEYNVLDIINLNDSSAIYFFGIILSIILICLELIYYKFGLIVCKLMSCLMFVF